MTFVELIAQNLRSRLARSILTGVAVAVGIMTVVALGVLTFSLKQTATSILRTGRADFSIAQKAYQICSTAPSMPTIWSEPVPTRKLRARSAYSSPAPISTAVIRCS